MQIVRDKVKPSPLQMANEDSTANVTLEYPDAEIVFGLVYAVGTDYRPVVDYLKNLLKRARYDPKEIHLSEYFAQIAKRLQVSDDELLSEGSESYQRIDSKMKAGNAIRAKAGDAGFLAFEM